jgi:hypothetical protein
MIIHNSKNHDYNNSNNEEYCEDRERETEEGKITSYNIIN